MLKCEGVFSVTLYASKEFEAESVDAAIEMMDDMLCDDPVELFLPDNINRDNVLFGVLKDGVERVFLLNDGSFDKIELHTNENGNEWTVF